MTLTSPVVQHEVSTSSRIAETHVSTLFFTGDRVYKLKKAVHNGFLDFTDVTAREAACHREVDLNRRLAPDVYLGVADITMAGETIDHLVVMQRLPENRRLSALLADPEAADAVDALAHLIVTFHAAALRSDEIDARCGQTALTELWRQGAEQLARFDGVLEARDLTAVDRLATEYAAGRGPLFAQRVADGWACDGHGDLQAEDIFCLPDGPRVLDCLEFDDDLRYGDALNDVGFLAMDLERLGHPDLATKFLARYRELSADNWPTSLADHYIAYRAAVRAKVVCLRHEQGDVEARSEARALLAMARHHLEMGQVHLVLVGGSPGSGKSTVSRELADRLGAVVISSDDVRDEMYPRTEERDGAAYGRGRYEPDRVQSVYAEMLRRAELLVARGESVVLDASWLDPQERRSARELAERTTTNMTELHCCCPPDVADARVRDRVRRGVDASEATVPIARTMRSTASPWPEGHVLDTVDPLDGVVGLAEAMRHLAELLTPLVRSRMLRAWNQMAAATTGT